MGAYHYMNKTAEEIFEILCKFSLDAERVMHNDFDGSNRTPQRREVATELAAILNYKITEKHLEKLKLLHDGLETLHGDVGIVDKSVKNFDKSSSRISKWMLAIAVIQGLGAFATIATFWLK